MKQLSQLFTNEYYSKDWATTKSSLKNSIDATLERGKCDEDVLLMMKALLEEIKIGVSITDYTNEVTDG